MATRLSTLLFAALLGLVAQEASAAVIVSNLDPANFPGSTYRTGTSLGQSMVTGGSTLNLASILFPQTAGVTAGETFTVFLRNTDGSLGASVFNNFTLTFDTNFGSTGQEVTTATSNSTFTLQPNTGYWFVLSTPGGTATVGWNSTPVTDYSAAFGATLPTTATALSTTGGTTTYRSLSGNPQLIQINGSAVPEPSSLATLGLALVGTGMVTFRRRTVAK